MLRPFTLSLLMLAVSPLVQSQVTVEYQRQKMIEMQLTPTEPGQPYGGLRAYDPTTLNAPAPPNPPTTAIAINLQPTSGQTGLSIAHNNPFLGFSIEMSVSSQLFGKNSSFINVPFLNLLANVVERAGEVHIRCGGNTQESAELVESNPDNRMIVKHYEQGVGTTATPPIDFTMELLYTMGNISTLLPGVKWFLGVPFNQTKPFRMDIVREAANVLGDKVLAWQAGNEPDFYATFGRRPKEYTPFDYMGEVGDLINTMEDPLYKMYQDTLLVPSLAAPNSVWELDDVWNTGIVDAYHDQIKFLSTERYPNNNCGAVWHTGPPVVPQDTIASYLDHTNIQNLVKYYLASTLFAQTKDKPFIMFETNTASCGGFPGISNSFTSALWGLDYALQMAYGNFTEALFHIGGQSVYYNPFTAAPTNQTGFHQWTVGPIYYSVLILAEAIGNSGKARVADLYINGNSRYTPAYVIHEDDQPARLALFNYVEDQTGGNDYTATVTYPGSISSVQVKRLTSKTVTQLANITWAGQTFGGFFESDGRPMGDIQIDTVDCTPNGGSSICAIKVPAPGFALVFFKPEENNGVSETVTFSTTVRTRTHNTATIDPSVLATSNGHAGRVALQYGSTSYGSNSATVPARLGVGLLCVLAGTMAIVLNRVR